MAIRHSRDPFSAAVFFAEVLRRLNCEGRKAGIQNRKTGFRVKPGMTNNAKGFITQLTSISLDSLAP